MTRSLKSLASVIALVAGVLITAVQAGVFAAPDADRDNTTSTSPSADSAPPTSSSPANPEGTYRPVGRRQLLRLLDQVQISAARPEVPGYDRECGTGHACSFGTDWSDDVDVAGGHDGCDTRNDILARDLRQITYRPDTNDCVVEAGVLDDPYTGTRIQFRKETAYEVGIDHVYPLALAWDMGASRWQEDRRRDFANDPINLIAVSGSANSSKGDSSPGEWMPINAGYRCAYVAGFLKVAIAYELPITRLDQDTVTAIAPSCHRRDGGPR